MGWTTPTDRSVGYTVSATDWNIVEDDLSFLYGDTSWTAVSSFLNSWVNYGAPYYNAAFRKIGTRVYLRGVIKSGTGATTAFILPAGYHPASSVRSGGDSNTGWSSVIVDSSGNVVPTPSAPTYFSLDNTSFDTI